MTYHRALAVGQEGGTVLEGPSHDDVVRDLHTLQGRARRTQQNANQWLSVRDGDVEITLDPLGSASRRRTPVRAGGVTDARLAALHLRLDALDTRLSSLLARTDSTAAMSRGTIA
jgi:hypothetical protein